MAAGYAVSCIGRENIQSLPFFHHAQNLKAELDRVTEMCGLLAFDDPFPFHGFPDLRPQFKKIEPEGSFLPPGDFLNLQGFILLVNTILVFFNERSDKYPEIQKQFGQFIPHPDLVQEILRVIDTGGQVKDKASETLQKIRRDLENKRSRARSRLESVLRDMHSKGFAQEDTLALREGRLVIPMKEGYRGRVKGLIVDQSASGATVFMEPLEILEINNEIRQLQARETQEIEKILKALTDRVRIVLPDIERNFMLAGRLDSLYARARFSLQIQGIAADINSNRNLHLIEACHPLLLERMERDDVIPLTLQMGEDRKTVVITGPNAGGKTVALKTVGLLVLMHQHGLHIPAKEGTTLPLFSNVFADIGDRQSIQQDLSTFSSHIAHLKIILDRSDDKSLILLDEIGSATDPAEGAALAESALQILTKKGCLTLATTHMGALKIFAHETPGVENGSMIFDQETLMPTYRFQMGIPGSSYAFEIAQRFGLLKKVIDDARERAGEERGKLDRLVIHLEEALHRSQTLLKEAEIKETRLSGLIGLYQERLETLQKSGNAKAQEIVRKAETLLQEANAEVERVVKGIRESQAQKTAIRQAKEAIQKRQKEVGDILKEEKKPDQSLNKGDRVKWPGHSGKGIIVSDPDSSGRVHVDWEGVTLRIPVTELSTGGQPREKKESSGISKVRLTSDVKDELDLRGFMAEEAIEALDKYLGDASSSGLHYLRIIHGKGTGVLRQEVNRFLKGHSLVKSRRLGNWNEGDTGVTIVELK